MAILVSKNAKVIRQDLTGSHHVTSIFNTVAEAGPLVGCNASTVLRRVQKLTNY